jgi:hypothetical protein
VTFEEYTALSTGRSPSAGGGHARQRARQHQLPGVAELVRRPRHTIESLHIGGIVRAVVARVRTPSNLCHCGRESPDLYGARARNALAAKRTDRIFCASATGCRPRSAISVCPPLRLCCHAPWAPLSRPGACTSGSRLWLPGLRLAFKKGHLAAKLGGRNWVRTSDPSLIRRNRCVAGRRPA